MGSLLHEGSLEKLAFSRPADLARHLQEKRTGNPVNRWPTEETLLGAFFDVTNPMKVGGADPQRDPGNRGDDAGGQRELQLRTDFVEAGSSPRVRSMGEGSTNRRRDHRPHRGTRFSPASRRTRPPRCEARQRFGVGCASRSARSFGIAVDDWRRNGASGGWRGASKEAWRDHPVRRARRGFVSSSGRTLKGNEAQEGEDVSRLATIGRTLRTRWRSKASKPTIRSHGVLTVDSGNGGGRRRRAGSGRTARGQRPR